MTQSTREWLVSAGLILAALLVFFGDALFTGKNFLAEGDNVAFYSFIPYLNAAKETGEFPLWVPYIFSGMPSLASFLAAGERSWDVVGNAVLFIPKIIGEGTGNDTWRLVLWYAIYGFGVYTLMRSKNTSQGVALFTALSAVFSTWVLVWIMIGHSTKPVSFATLPWILFALERLRERLSLQMFFVLTLAMVTLVTATHPQMMFYIGCAAALYLVTELITRIIRKEGALDVLKAGAALGVATILALATHADMFLASREYTPSSTRGSAPLVQAKGTQQEDGGNDYEYATNWSFSPEEVITFFVPNYYGFGKLKVESGRGGKESVQTLYWGQMPFTDAANYMGIGVLLLGVLGAWFNRRDPFVIFLIVLSVFSLLLSFGKNFSVLYDVFFNYVPAFNKFRAPSMALHLMQFAMPVLAGYGLTTVLSWAGDKQRQKLALGIAGVAAAFLVIGFVYTNIAEEDYQATVAQTLVDKDADDKLTDPKQISSGYTQLVFDEMKGDWLGTGFLALCFGGLILLTVRGSIKPNVAMYAAIGITVIDLWRVASRPYEPSEGSPEQRVFRRTEVVDFIKSDKGVFRIADLTNNPANWWAYHFVENVHGYSSAKIRVYQDMLDVAARGPGSEPVPGNSVIVNPFLWNLLNVKYIVANQPVFNGEPAFRSSTGTYVYSNPSVLPRAWFVDTVRVESNARTTLNHLRDGDFDARATAFTMKDLGVPPASGAIGTSVRVTHKGNQHLTFACSTDVQRLLVVSEVFYKEWHCFVDGKEVPIHRTNFLLRGVVVPAGEHTVSFRFISPAFQTGKTVSIASNAIIILIGFGAFAMLWRGRNRTQQTA